MDLEAQVSAGDSDCCTLCPSCGRCKNCGTPCGAEGH